MSNAEAREQSLRLFIAIPLPAGVKEAIERAQSSLRAAVSKGRIGWTRPEQFHLTIKFLGDIDSARITFLAQDLTRVCQNFPALDLRAQTIGAFPNWRFPRVIWIGIQEGENRLGRLYELISTVTAQYTGRPDRDSFDGHVTIGRVKGIQRPEAQGLSKIAADLARHSFGQWMANTLELMRSELLPEGARHTCLAEIELEKENHG